MKIKITALLISLSFVLAELCYSAVPVMIEHVVPQFFGSKSGASANNSRTPFSVCLEIQGLSPNTTYDVQIGVGLTTDAATVYGAGNIWNRNRNAFTGQRDTAAFTTDANGNSGPFWSYIQPTGNGSRFNAGQLHNLRVGYTLSGGSFSSDPAFVGTKVMTALDIPITPRTTETTDDGAFITGKNFSSYSGKFVLLFNDTSSSALPLSSYQIRTATATNTSQSELPVSVNDILIQGGTSSVGDFACVFPIGANNPNGLRKIEIRNSDNSVAQVLMDYDGTWQNGTNTSALLRRDVGVIDFAQLFRLDLTALIEGFYSASSNTLVPDAVTVELHQSTSPFGIMDYNASGLGSSGTGRFYLCNAVNGTSYYVVLKHRNSVETWSSAGVLFTAGTANYDFTSSASQAYGSNMVQVDVSPVEFAVYSGDVNQDGTVDASDLGVIDNDAFTFASGYIPSDLNGDGFADASDYSLADNNAFNFVGRIAP
ncbi:MAG: hypothetical protein K1X85_00675 [Ignavibacteria bacterium]|nr:hypothetical protein [Ignavibacteria bacterium]